MTILKQIYIQTASPKFKMYSIKDSHTYPLMDSEQVKLIPSTLKKPAAEVPPDDKSVHSEIQSPIRRNS